MNIYNHIISSKKQGKKLFAVLIDPDSLSLSDVEKIVRTSVDAHVDLFLIGGSLLLDANMDLLIQVIKGSCDIPCVIFPGNNYQINDKADGLLLLSLISGRNPELLIGKHVESAGILKKSGLEIISTGYILVDGGSKTSVNYMSHTHPIPHQKNAIAVATALAGEMLGLKMVYLEAGSGAQHPVTTKMIQSVRASIDIPIIVGGGIRTPEKAADNCKAGADMIVVGNAIEKDPQLIIDLSAAIHSTKGILH